MAERAKEDLRGRVLAQAQLLRHLGRGHGARLGQLVPAGGPRQGRAKPLPRAFISEEFGVEGPVGQPRAGQGQHPWVKEVGQGRPGARRGPQEGPA